jgi:hypothetical protein
MREILYNILTEFGLSTKLARLIKLCLNQTYNSIRIGKQLAGNFSIQNGPKQGEALSPLFFGCDLN